MITKTIDGQRFFKLFEMYNVGKTFWKSSIISSKNRRFSKENILKKNFYIDSDKFELILHLSEVFSETDVGKNNTIYTISRSINLQMSFSARLRDFQEKK